MVKETIKIVKRIPVGGRYVLPLLGLALYTPSANASGINQNANSPKPVSAKRSQISGQNAMNIQLRGPQLSSMGLSPAQKAVYPNLSDAVTTSKAKRRARLLQTRRQAKEVAMLRAEASALRIEADDPQDGADAERREPNRLNHELDQERRAGDDDKLGEDHVSLSVVEELSILLLSTGEDLPPRSASARTLAKKKRFEEIIEYANSVKQPERSVLTPKEKTTSKAFASMSNQEIDFFQNNTLSQVLAIRLAREEECDFFGGFKVNPELMIDILHRIANHTYLQVIIPKPGSKDEMHINLRAAHKSNFSDGILQYLQNNSLDTVRQGQKQLELELKLECNFNVNVNEGTSASFTSSSNVSVPVVIVNDLNSGLEQESRTSKKKPNEDGLNGEKKKAIRQITIPIPALSNEELWVNVKNSMILQKDLQNQQMLKLEETIFKKTSALVQSPEKTTVVSPEPSVGQLNSENLVEKPILTPQKKKSNKKQSKKSDVVPETETEVKSSPEKAQVTKMAAAVNSELEHLEKALNIMEEKRKKENEITVQLLGSDIELAQTEDVSMESNQPLDLTLPEIKENQNSLVFVEETNKSQYEKLVKSQLLKCNQKALAEMAVNNQRLLDRGIYVKSLVQIEELVGPFSKLISYQQFKSSQLVHEWSYKLDKAKQGLLDMEETAIYLERESQKDQHGKKLVKLQAAVKQLNIKFFDACLEYHKTNKDQDLAYRKDLAVAEKKERLKSENKITQTEKDDRDAEFLRTLPKEDVRKALCPLADPITSFLGVGNLFYHEKAITSMSQDQLQKLNANSQEHQKHIRSQFRDQALQRYSKENLQNPTLEPFSYSDENFAYDKALSLYSALIDHYAPAIRLMDLTKDYLYLRVNFYTGSFTIGRSSNDDRSGEHAANSLRDLQNNRYMKFAEFSGPIINDKRILLVAMSIPICGTCLDIPANEMSLKELTFWAANNKIMIPAIPGNYKDMNRYHNDMVAYETYNIKGRSSRWTIFDGKAIPMCCNLTGTDDIRILEEDVFENDKVNQTLIQSNQAHSGLHSRHKNSPIPFLPL